MKRRDFMRLCLAAPFMGLIKGKKEPKYEFSGDHSSPSISASTSISSSTPVYDNLYLTEKYKKQIKAIDIWDRRTGQYKRIFRIHAAVQKQKRLLRMC